VAAAAALPVAVRARRRITRRVMPFLLIIYVVAYLDRVNVAYAALEMQRALGFSDKVFGAGAGIFFLGYFLLEIPGALIVERWSARKWIARIMISWGLVTILTAWVKTSGQFYAARFVLGAAEAGFFPGIIVYLTHWFRYEDRAKAVAMFMSATAISNVLGSPVAGLILGVNWLGIPGWRWLFILEGIPAVILGVVTIFWLTDRPQQARWLPDDERDWIVSELEREREAKKRVRSFRVLEALRNRDVILLALIYFFAITAHYGFILWLPTIISRASGLANFQVTMLASLPYIAGLVTMLLLGWHSDKTGERRWHATVPLLACAMAFLASLYSGSNLAMAIALFTIAGAGLHGYLPAFWALPTITLSESAAAASIGLINSVGNLGGFAGPFVVGYLRTRFGSFEPGMVYLASGLMVSALLIQFLHLHKKAPPQKGDSLN